MPYEIQRIQDRVKLTAAEAEKIIKSHMENALSRDVAAIEFHKGRDGELGAVTVYLKFEDK